ncbi:hypothetical protein EDB80DRAFT_863617 [Ilyonectria destructans]|nr:hypothetical protein EDB80DRAFT_863617 [Ilyonectria destructans]
MVRQARHPDDAGRLSWRRVFGRRTRLILEPVHGDKETSEGAKSADVTKKTNSPTTWRVVGVPLDWSAERLQDFLADRQGTTPVVKSIAQEIDGSSKTATITFQDRPHFSTSHQSERIQLPTASDGDITPDQSITLDKGFLGITTLYTPRLDDHKIDVIALSGLGGHAFGSFKERGGNHMWLRDSLPHDLLSETGQRMARVMIYGYESGVADSKNTQNIEDLATTFHSSLLALATPPATRPIILIAHSLGGLIVKQALMTLSKSENEDDQTLIQAIYGIVFFGVPHDGMDISSLLPMVGDGPNRFLVESIGHVSSQILAIQQREFHTALGDKDHSEVFCFYETLKSPTAQQDENGRWEMKGPAAVLVTKSSATHGRHWEDGPEHICAIARNHSDMVKFGPQDHEYANVRQRLRNLARRALTVQSRTQSKTKFLVPYNPNPDFVGRSKILHVLKQQLGLGQPLGSATRTRVALHGLGGVGKTQIALAYVYWLRETRPDVTIFWVHASNAERFQKAYASIATECNIPGHDDPKADLLDLVRRWLETTYQTRWLMVIDNADDTELFFPCHQEEGSSKTANAVTHTDRGLGHYIPECRHGSIFVTTRNKQTGLRLTRGKPPIEVGNMDGNEAHLLLCAILENDQLSKDETSPLSSKLEHLPLALAQAAAFIQANGTPINEYIHLLDESDSELVDRLSEPFETVGRDSETPHAVTATWIISFEQIQQQNAFTSDVLSFLSLFHRQAIPKDFVDEYCDHIQPNDADPIGTATITKALGTLKAFSFISEDKDRNMDMHRLVQLVMRKWLAIKGRMAEFARQALKTLSAIYPYGEFETRDACLKMLPHAYAVLENSACVHNVEPIAKATLLSCMGAYFSFQGIWEVAEKHQAEAASIFMEQEGNEHRSSLSAMGRLASTYREQGRWEEAEKLEVQVMEVLKIQLGTDHPDTLTSMNNLASTFWDQDRWEEAEELLILVVETQKTKLGADHPDTLTSMNNLASTFWNPDRWEEAEELLISVMETQKTKLGADHPDTLTSMANLGFIWKSQGRSQEALTLMEACAETQRQVLGMDHPDTISSLSAIQKWSN